MPMQPMGDSYVLTLVPISRDELLPGMKYSVAFLTQSDSYAEFRAEYLAAASALISKAEAAHPKFWNYILQLDYDDD